MRRGGTVCRLVDSNPCRMRSPSGESVTVKSHKRAHPSPDGVADEDGEPDEEPDAEAGRGLMAVLVADHGEHRPDEQQYEPPRDHLEQDGSHQQPVGDGHHRSLGGLRVLPPHRHPSG